MNIAIITQKLDSEDYVFGFFYGHIIDLARVCDTVHVICLEKGKVDSLPQNVIVHSLGKEEGVSKFGYVQRLFSFLFNSKNVYDTVFVYMEPLYILLGGWWWFLTGKKIVLWYNHVYSDFKLKLASVFTTEIIGVSKEGIPVDHKNIKYISYERDLTNILTGK